MLINEELYTFILIQPFLLFELAEGSVDQDYGDSFLAKRTLIALQNSHPSYI